MSLLHECRAAGIPESLLIPILPWNVPDKEGKNAGKMPAQIDNNGNWMPLHNWRQGSINEHVLRIADEKGCNWGLILGSPDAAEQWNFAAVDVDLNEGEEVHRARIVHKFSEHWSKDGKIIRVRNTVPHRALLLLRVTDVMSSGHKAVYKLFYKNPAEGIAETQIGKLEFLTTGQQAVIVGRHYSDVNIGWFAYGFQEGYHVPVLTDGKADAPPLPSFATHADIIEGIEAVLNSLIGSGYRFEAKYMGSPDVVPDANLAPPWLSVDKLVRLVERMQNPLEVDRDIYVEVMMAIAAAKCGIAIHHGSLTSVSEQKIKLAAVEWAAKWPNPSLGPGESAEEYEAAKWDADWGTLTGGFHTSYDRLVSLAMQLGVKDAAAECAQEEFTADVRAPTTPPISPDDLPYTGPKRGESMVYVDDALLSDLRVIDYIRRERQWDQNACWIAASQQWMLWDGQRGWLTSDDTEATINFTIMQELKTYAAKHQAAGTPQAWKRGEVNSMLSVGRMEKVNRGLSQHLAVSSSDINKAPEFLQTPIGTYNLNTLLTIPMHQRWTLRDTRRTRVAPTMDDTPTRLFDDLLMLLADGNKEVVNWLWHYFGYALIGNPKAQCFLVLWGPGGNGKGTLVKVLEHIFGDYATPLENRVLLDSGKNDHKTELNLIRYRRLATVAEMPKNEKWNESILKKLTGEDMIHARNMRENASAFTSEAAIIVHCNEMPSFSKITPAILRRFRMVGTMKTPETVDPKFGEKIIRSEGSAILWKCMRYAQRVLQNDFALPALPESMESQRNQTLMANDKFFAWLQMECDLAPNDETAFEPLVDLKSRYEAWLARASKDDGGMVADKVQANTFKMMLKERGVRVETETGQPIRIKVKRGQGIMTSESCACGIRLKLKAVA